MATSTCATAHSFPFTVSEAVRTARMWFAPRTSSMTLCGWRDHFLSLHLAGIRCDDWQERTERTAVWNAAFNVGVAEVIAGGVSHG